MSKDRKAKRSKAKRKRKPAVVTPIRPEAVSLRTFAQMFGIGYSTAAAHATCGNLNTVRIGADRRVTDREIARVKRQGLPSLSLSRAKEAA